MKKFIFSREYFNESEDEAWADFAKDLEQGIGANNDDFGCTEEPMEDWEHEMWHQQKDVYEDDEVINLKYKGKNISIGE